jgi:hypothetical protein
VADANLTIGIHTSQAERDAKKIVNELNNIQNAADKLSDGAEFHIDTSEIDSESRKVKDSLKSVENEAKRVSNTPIDIKVDTQGLEEFNRTVKRTLNEIVERGKNTKVPISFDTDSVPNIANDLVDRLKDEIDKNLERGISVETSLKIITEAAEAEIDRIMREVESESVSIPVSADTNQATSDVQKLKTELGRVRGANPKIKVDVDASGVDELADSLQDVDKAADDVKGSADSAAASLKKIEDAAERAAASADKFSASLRNLLMSDELLEVLGEGMLIVAESIVTAITAFEDYEDAVQAATGSSESAAAAMGMLEDFALNTTAGIEDVVAAFVELRTNGLDASRESLQAYGNVAAGLNLTMEEMAQAVGDAAARNFSKLNETQLKAKESGDKVIFTYHGVTTEVANTSKAIAGFIKQMGDAEFAGAMEDQAGGVTGAFEAMSEAWRKLSRDMGEGGVTQGLINFQTSMTETAKAAEELGRMIGSWLGAELTGLGNFIQTTVREVTALIDAFSSLGSAIMSIPLIGSAISGAKNLLDSYLPNLMVPQDLATQPEAPAAPVAGRTAFGADTETAKKTRRGGKSDAQRQQESFEKQFAANDKMFRTLDLMDGSFERGRESVVGFRNAIEETTQRTSLLSQVGEKHTDTLMEQRAVLEGLRESIAYKGEVLDQQEAIMQTVQLTEAYKDGSGAVKDAQASIEAYNTAVQYGMVAIPEVRAELEELARAAITANDNLKFEQSMTGFDQQIESAAKMATAFREGGPAIREAALEQAVYAQAVADGVEEDEDQVNIIREKMQALRDLQDVQAADERAMNVGLDIEQMQRELGLTRLMGEARFMEAARIEMLMNKKRELKDVTAELTNEELKQADALGRMQYQAANAGNSLLDLAERYGDVNKQMQNVALGGALALEDSLVDIITGAKSAREAFADFARTVAEQMMRAAIQMAVIRPLLMGLGGMFAGGGVMTSSGPMSLPMYANGGIMSPLGDVPLKTYSVGGIANSPQMAIFGEGKMPEAYVPLPDGRRIPVKMEGGGGGGGNALAITNNINVNMPQNATREQGEQFGDAIARQVEDAMNANLMKQQRPGGLLDPYGYGAA